MREKFSGIRALAMFAVCSLCMLIATAQPAHAKYIIQTLGATPAQCANQTEPLIEALKTIPYPEDWTFVVVCTDAEWDHLSRIIEPLRGTDTAGTVLPKHVTILRGAIFTRQIERGPLHTLWHELGHVVLNTMSESKADGYAFDHLK
jgi:hypothetical protein